MADRARSIVAANGLGGVIRVLKGTLETVSLPEKVDVIVSEWMGYFLLRESMLDSVLVARDAYLKPSGSLFPSHATLFLAPMGPCKELRAKWHALNKDQAHWKRFAQNMWAYYEIDFTVARDDYLHEQQKYNLQTGLFANLSPKSLVGAGQPVLELDLRTASLQELREPTRPLTCCMKISRDGPVEGFCGYFDTQFLGSPSYPVAEEVTLTTAPDADATTHWGQQVFGFFPPLQARKGDTLECTMSIYRQEKNHRLLRLEATFLLRGAGGKGGSGDVKEERAETWYVD